MRIYRSLDEIPSDAFARGTAVAIGKFDGVHLGHRALIEGIAATAEERGLEPLVFTFENSPLSILRPDIELYPIMSAGQRLDAIEEAGASTAVMIPFDRELSLMPAEEFMERVLVDLLHARHVILGKDFRFGHGGTGDAELLRRGGERLGFTVEVVEQVDDPELGRVSSSRVREAIVQGDVGVAARMMGRPVAVRGEVVHGDARGRELGFPTANLGDPIEGLVPAYGVYAGWVVVGGRRYQAAISVGVNLTFGEDGPARVEANLLDFSDDIYGERIEVRFAERLRGMVAFSGVDALVERIHEDVRQARDVLIGR